MIGENINTITKNIANVLTKSTKTNMCNLVAVSKTKPMEDIQKAYDFGHRRFGENYIDEFVEKSNTLPLDI